MKFENLDYQLLARYLAGECTTEEVDKVEAWLSEDVENRKKFNKLQRIWDTSAGSSEGVIEDFFNPRAEWDKLQGRLLKKEGEDLREINEPTPEPKFRAASIHSMGQKIARVAAIFLVAGLVGVLSYQNWYQPEPKAEEPVLKEIRTANAQRANLSLGDGTKVLLNAGSVVRFPDQFEENVREVYLEGEAYFDVERNPSKPFVIHSRGSVTRVLGTSFSIRSYDEDGQVRVVVNEGKVSFESEDQESSQKTVLTANELGRYNIEQGKIEVSKVKDMELYLSWREGYLKFQEEPMHNVARALERRYGVTVHFEDVTIEQKMLTAFLKSRSLSNVLDVIAMSLEIDYQLTEDKVRFFNKSNQ